MCDCAHDNKIDALGLALARAADGQRQVHAISIAATSDRVRALTTLDAHAGNHTQNPVGDRAIRAGRWAADRQPSVDLGWSPSTHQQRPFAGFTQRRLDLVCRDPATWPAIRTAIGPAPMLERNKVRHAARAVGSD